MARLTDRKPDRDDIEKTVGLAGRPKVITRIEHQFIIALRRGRFGQDRPLRAAVCIRGQFSALLPAAFDDDKKLNL